METELFALYINVEGIAGIGRAAAESFKVERFGHADIGHRPDAHGIAEHGDEGEKVPAEEAEVEREKLALVPGHHGLGFTDALHGRLCGIVDEDIDSLTVTVVGNDSRKHEQHRPQADKDRFENVQDNDLEPEAEAIKEVAEAGRIAAGGVEQEKNKARADDAHHDGEQRVEEIGGRGRGDNVKVSQRVLIVALGVILEITRGVGIGHVDGEQP